MNVRTKLQEPETNRTAPGAKVEYAERTVSYIGRKLLGPPLRLRAGDERMRKQVEGEPEEGNMPDDVGERLAALKAHNVCGKPLGLRIS